MSSQETPAFPDGLSTSGLHYLPSLASDPSTETNPTSPIPFQAIERANLTNLEHTLKDRVIPVYTISLPYPDEKGLKGDALIIQILDKLDIGAEEDAQLAELAQALRHESQFCFRGSKSTQITDTGKKIVSIARHGLEFPPSDVRRSGISLSIGVASSAFDFATPKPLLEELEGERTKYSIVLIYEAKGIEYAYGDPATSHSYIKITDGETLRDKLRAVILIHWESDN